MWLEVLKRPLVLCANGDASINAMCYLLLYVIYTNKHAQLIKYMIPSIPFNNYNSSCTPTDSSDQSLFIYCRLHTCTLQKYMLFLIICYMPSPLSRYRPLDINYIIMHACYVLQLNHAIFPLLDRRRLYTASSQTSIIKVYQNIPYIHNYTMTLYLSCMVRIYACEVKTYVASTAHAVCLQKGNRHSVACTKAYIYKQCMY